jgi:hypothetical protein
VLDGVFGALQPTTAARSGRSLRHDLAALDAKIARLTAAVEDGDALAPIVEKLRARQAERDALLAEIGAADAMQTLTVDRKAIERQVLAKVAEWRRLLDGDIAKRAAISPRDPRRPDLFPTGGRRVSVHCHGPAWATDHRPHYRFHHFGVPTEFVKAGRAAPCRWTAAAGGVGIPPAGAHEPVSNSGMRPYC